MDSLAYEAEKLGVDPGWLASRSVVIGLGRCPQCWPENDIMQEGNFIEPCTKHAGGGVLESPDDSRVTAARVEILGTPEMVV